MKCKDCKHWRPDQMCGIDGLGYCERIKMMWDATEWGDDYKRKVKDDADKAFVQDGSDYSAVLISFPDFGCVMFEAKNEKV